MQLFYGVPEDIENWMSLVTQVLWNFPGLETQEKLNEHRATVLKFMDKRQAICIKDENEIAGVMLFSRGHNMICYLAVSPEYRRRGVASILMDEVLTNLDRTKEISVSTFRADDEKGTAPRALYEKYHFSPDDDYPEFKYYEGLPYLNDFYLEVHYEGTRNRMSRYNGYLLNVVKPCTQPLCELARFSWIMETLNCSVMSRCLADRATEKKYEFCNERTNKQRLVE